PSNTLRSVGDFLFNPRNIEKHATVGTAPAGLDFVHDAARDVIAGKQLRWAAGVFVALGIFPPFFGIVGSLRFVGIRDVGEHEALAFLIEQDTALAANAFSDEYAHDTRRPNHPGRV